MPAKKNDGDNYNPDSALKETRDKLERPDKFADIFCAAAESQVKIKETLTGIVKDILLKDKDIDLSLKEIFKKIVSDDKTHFIMRLLDKFKYVMSVMFGVAITILTQLLLKKLGLM